MLGGATFLPLTLATLASDPGLRSGGVSAAARRVERGARTAWQSLLAAPDAPVGTDLAVHVRRLSLIVGGFVGPDRWAADRRGHCDRVTGYQLWLEETLSEGDGAGFARALAGYDEAIARAVVDAAARTDTSGRAKVRRHPGRPGATGECRSGTIAGWAKQARAGTARVMLPAALRHQGTSTTSRPGTSSSRWSRHSRSAG